MSRITRSKVKLAHQENLPTEANVIDIQQPKKRGRKPKIQQPIHTEIATEETEATEETTKSSLDTSSPSISRIRSSSSCSSSSSSSSISRSYKDMPEAEQSKLAIDILISLDLEKHVKKFELNEITVQFLVDASFEEWSQLDVNLKDQQKILKAINVSENAANSLDIQLFAGLNLNDSSNLGIK